MTECTPVQFETRVRVRRPVNKFAPEHIVNMGTFEIGIDAAKWAGWPNGSAYFGVGHIYRGRTIVEKRGRVHALRWNPIKREHKYIGCYANSLGAMAVL